MSDLGQNIINIGFDPEKFDASKDHIIDGLNQVKQVATELPAQLKAVFDSIAAQSGSNIKVGSTGGYTELKSKIGDLQSTTEIYNKAVQVTTDRIAAMNGQSKEFTSTLLNETKAMKESAAAKLNEAKTTTESIRAKILETKETERSTAAKTKEAQKTKELSEPYKQLALRFAAAANEAKNLAAQYGTQSNKAQEAARVALGLNNQLKAIDQSIGNHQRSVGDYGKSLDSVGDKLKNFGLQLLSLVGIFSVASFFKDSIDAFLELDKATRLLQNTLKNIGAPELFGRIEEGTKKLTTQFKFLREEDVQTVFNKLIIYGKLTENQINDLLPVIINFATATGRDLPEAASLITKALEGNAKGLREFGINMKEGKDVTERLSLVMTELKPRVEGVADAFGESAAGKIASSREEFRKIKEEVGQGLIPVFVALLSGIDKVLTGLGYLSKRSLEVFEDILSFGKSADLREIAKQFETESKVAKKFVDEFDGKPIKEVSEAINDLNLKLVDRQRILAAAKANKSGIFTAQDVKDEELRIRIVRKELEGLYKLQDTNKNKILGPGDPDGHTKDKIDDTADKNAKAAFEILKIERERRAEAAKEFAKDDKKDYLDRLVALNEYGNIKKAMIESQAAFELRNKKLTEKEIELVEAKRIDATIKLAKDLTDILKINVDDFKKGATEMGTAVTGMQQSISDALKSIQVKNDELRDDLIEKNKKTFAAAKKKESELEVKAAEEAATLIQTLGDATFEREKNRIQKLIDANNEYAQAETERINNSTLSEQDKASKLIQLQATTNEKNKEFARRQKEEDIKKARFDKAFTIAKIIESTAQAEVEALSYLTNLATAPLYPGIATLIGVIGALQLAVAIAAPIPTYAKGTKDHPGGLARFGEAGAEAVILPDGKGFIANKDTTGFLPKHARVVPLTNDQVNEAMYRAMITGTAERLSVIQARENAGRSIIIDTDRIVEAIERSGKKTIVKVNNNIGADFHLWVNRYVNGKD